MQRRKFLKNCCYSVVATATISGLLQSCGSYYYATVLEEKNKLVIPTSEFIKIKKDKAIARKFVFVKSTKFDFPVCVYKIDEENYFSSLMKCTHRGCELNVGGGIYSCPCHGSEFSIIGNVLEGPAEKKLRTFKTTLKNENIYVYLS